MEPTIFDLLISIAALPFQAVQFVVYTVMGFLVFDILGLRR